jgi:polyisoprenoid-binding protein YceI
MTTNNPAAAPAALATYAIDPVHTTVDFRVRHMMVADVRGEFSGVTGSLVFDRQNIANSKVEAVVDARTINTRDPQRDQHVRSADFLDVEKWPAISFASRQFKHRGGDRWAVAGDLTIRGVTRPVTLEVEGPTPETKDPWGNMRVGVSAATKINRKDFGLVWNVALETGGVLVGDEVTIHLDVELIRK